MTKKTQANPEIQDVQTIPTLPEEMVWNYVAARLKSFTHLKLHKILYFVQGYHLAYFDAPLFKEDFQAWVHGPVLPTLYSSLKKTVQKNMHDKLAITDETAKKYIKVFEKAATPEQVSLIKDIVKSFGKFDGYQLEAITHSQEPWIAARNGIDLAAPSSAIIPKKAMKSYFKHEQGW